MNRYLITFSIEEYVSAKTELEAERLALNSLRLPPEAHVIDYRTTVEPVETLSKQGMFSPNTANYKE